MNGAVPKTLAVNLRTCFCPNDLILRVDYIKPLVLYGRAFF
jgi:hypothetical protein